MAIEYLTSDLVKINGHLVELYDRREPDKFDLLFEEDNKEVLAEWDGPLQDVDLHFPIGLRSIFWGRRPEALVYKQIPRFIDLAKKAAKEWAVSYRDFKVGASAYAVSLDGLRAAYLFGANNTPYPGAPKDCAEMDIIKKVNQRGLDRIVALAIFGPPDSGTVNRVNTATLHPCDVCRTQFSEDPAVRDDTLFIMGSPSGEIELMLAPDLLSLHAD